MQTLLARGKQLTPFTDVRDRVELIECVAVASIVIPMRHGTGGSIVGVEQGDE